MDLNLSESEQLVQASLREFLDAEVTPEVVSSAERAEELPRELWDRLAAQRWLGVGVPEADGGEGGSLVEWAIALQELGHAAFPGPVVEQLTAARFLMGHDRCAEVASGRQVVSLAIQDRPSAPVVARPGSPAGVVLEGTKMLVPYGRAAQALLVSAPLDGADHYWRVATGTPGVRLEPLRSVSRDQQTCAGFSAAPAEAVGARQPRPGADLLELYLLARDAFCLGLLERILELTVDYARQREQFGRPIGSFQAVQYRCVDMALAYHGARGLLFQAVWLVGRDRPCAREQAMCHAAVRDAAGEVIAHAHQVHGAIGATDGYPLQLFSRRAKIYQHTLGTAAEFRARIAKLDESLSLPEASEPLAGGFA